MKEFLTAAAAKAWPIWLTLISRLGIKTLSNALEKRLKDGSPAETLVLAVTPPLLTTVDVLSDQDPDNQSQVEHIWKAWLHDFMLPFIFNLFKPATDKIKQDYNRAFVQFIADDLQIITGFLTDEIEPNQEQIAAFGKELLQDPKTKELFVDQFIGGNLAAAKLNADLVDFVKQALGVAYDAVVNGIAPKALEGEQVSATTTTYELNGLRIAIERVA
jgi:hypothetical protein